MTRLARDLLGDIAMLSEQFGDIRLAAARIEDLPGLEHQPELADDHAEKRQGIAVF